MNKATTYQNLEKIHMPLVYYQSYVLLVVYILISYLHFLNIFFVNNSLCMEATSMVIKDQISRTTTSWK